MKTILKKGIIKLIICSVIFNACTKLSESQNGISNKMDVYLNAFEKKGYSGAILLAEKGELTLHKGYGMANDSLKSAVSINHIWTIGSITKPFTAVAILQLEMRGLLNTQDPIGKYIPGLDNEKAALTIHHLLTHSAGLVEYGGSDAESIDKSDFIEFVNQTILRSIPGQEFHYSNVGYSLLGIIIENISNVSYEDYLQKNIFEPAGMKHTGYQLPNWEHHLFAEGYSYNGKIWGNVFEKNNYQKQVSWNLKANGGLLSTPMDMYKFYEALKGELLLSGAAKEKMYHGHIQAPSDFSPFNAKAKGFYGYGWAVTKAADGQKVILHGGSNDIFVAGLMFYPDSDLFFFITSNRVKYPASDAIIDLDKIVSGKKYQLPEPELVLDKKEAENLLGDYLFDDGSVVHISAGEDIFKGKLIIRPVNSGAYLKIIGKPIGTKKERQVSIFVNELLEKSRMGEPFSILIPGYEDSKQTPYSNPRDQDSEVVIGIDPNENPAEAQIAFWKKDSARIGEYQSHQFWGAVGEENNIVACTKVSFEKEILFIEHIFKKGRLERIRSSKRPVGLILWPKSEGRFVEKNNNASYRFKSKDQQQKVDLDIRIRKQKFKAQKEL